MNKIVAVVGMSGSGKTSVIETFKECGFNNVYFGDVTFDELKRRKLEVTPENEKLVREQLRATGDNAIYAKLSEHKINNALKLGNVSIESMYSWEEYVYIKERFKENFKVLAIVTNADLRHKRLTVRKDRALTLEQAKDRDTSEIENINKAGPIAIADYYVLNNGTSQELKRNVLKVIDSITKEKLHNEGQEK